MMNTVDDRIDRIVERIIDGEDQFFYSRPLSQSEINEIKQKLLDLTIVIEIEQGWRSMNSDVVWIRIHR